MSAEVECGAVADHLATLGDDRQTAYISVIQQHSSRLEKLGCVTYNDRAKTVTTRQELHDVHGTHLAVENVLD